MADDIQLPGLSIPVTADLAPMGRQNAEVQRAADRLGKSYVDKFRAHFSQAKGRKAAKDFTDGMERQFMVAQADIRESLARGLISPQDAERMAREAGRQYKESLLAEIKRRSAAGTLTDRDFVDLTERLERVGDKSGAEFNDGLMARVRRLPGLVQGVIAGGVAVAIARGMRRAVEAVGEFGRIVGETNQVSRGFSALTTGRGINPADALRELRQGTNGAVEGIELMRRSNLLLNSELPITAEQLGELAQLSRRLAESQGRDAADGFDRFARGIVKMETELLDELGIMVRVDAAVKEYAASHGKSVETLTQGERQLALYNAVVDQARIKVAALGQEELDAGTRVAQAAAYWDDLKRAVLEAIAESPRVESFFRAMGVGAEDAGSRVDSLADKIAAFLESSEGLSTIGFGIGGAILGAAAAPAILPGLAVGGLVGTLGGSAIGQQLGRGKGSSYDERVAERERERAHDAQVQAIRAETDIGKLETERLRLRNLLIDTQREDSNNVQAQARLLEQIRATEETIARLRNPPGGAGDSAATEAELKRIQAARESLEQRVREFELIQSHGQPAFEAQATELPALLQQVIAYDREIAELESEIADTRGQAPPGAQDLLAATRAQRDAAATTARAMADGIEENSARVDDLKARVIDLRGALIRMGEVGPAVALGDSFATVTGGVQSLTRAVNEAKEATEELQRAQLSGDQDRITAALERQEAAQQAVARASATAIKIFEAGAEQGLISQAELNSLIERMVELLNEAGIKTEDIADAGRDWEDLARTVEGLARGVLSVADAMGVLDDESRKVLQGIVDIAAATSRLVASGGTDIGAWAQAIGGAVGVVGSLFSGGSEAQRRSVEAMLDLEDAIRELESTILRSLSPRDVSEDRREIGATIDSLGQMPFGITGKNARFAWLASQRGFQNIAELERWAEGLDERYGTNLAEFVRNRDERGFRNALEMVDEQLGDIDLGTFGSSLDERLDAMHFRFDQLGEAAGSASDRIAAFIGAIRESEALDPSKQTEFDDKLQAIIERDGVQAAASWVNSLSEAWASGGLNNPLIRETFGSNLTGDEIQRLLEEADPLLDAALTGIDGFTDGVNRATEALVNVPQGFRILNLELARFNAAQAVTATDLLPPDTPVPLPDPITPPDAPGTRERPTFDVTQTIGPVSIQIVQQPGEDGAALGDRAWSRIKDRARQDNLIAGRDAGDLWGPGF